MSQNIVFKKIERTLFKRIELWAVFLIIIVGILATIFISYSVYYKMNGGTRAKEVTRIAMQIARLPEGAYKLFTEMESAIQPQLSQVPKAFEFEWLKVVDPEFRDSGYILVSGFRPENDISSTYLFDISAQKVLYQWIPPIEKINEGSSFRGDVNDRAMYRNQHPLLMENGDILITSGEGPLVRIDKCGNHKWQIERHFHHSIELDHNDNFIVPHVIPNTNEARESEVAWKKFVSRRDDGFATVDNDGNIVKEWSVVKILEDNGYFGLLYGVGSFENDRTHVNDAEPILESDEFVKKGDVVISSRHLSTVFLYRPSTNKVIWLKTGPWLNQHDVDYNGNGKFSIFGNNSVRYKGEENVLYGGSAIYQYDQSTDKITKLLDFRKQKKRFISSQGLHRVLDNGDIFVENTNGGIISRFSSDGELRWKFVNTVDNGQVGALHWSRYLGKNEINLSWMSNSDCPR